MSYMMNSSRRFNIVLTVATSNGVRLMMRDKCGTSTPETEPGILFSYVVNTSIGVIIWMVVQFVWRPTYASGKTRRNLVSGLQGLRDAWSLPASARPSGVLERLESVPGQFRAGDALSKEAASEARQWRRPWPVALYAEALRYSRRLYVDTVMLVEICAADGSLPNAFPSDDDGVFTFLKKFSETIVLVEEAFSYERDEVFEPTFAMDDSLKLCALDTSLSAVQTSSRESVAVFLLAAMYRNLHGMSNAVLEKMR